VHKERVGIRGITNPEDIHVSTLEMFETPMRRFGCGHIGGGHVDHELSQKGSQIPEAGGPSISGDYVDR
jgi:hypothetical protein